MKHLTLLLIFLVLLSGACTPAPQVVEVTRPVRQTVEVTRQVEVTRVVPQVIAAPKDSIQTVTPLPLTTLNPNAILVGHEQIYAFTRNLNEEHLLNNNYSFV
jgi:H2-forming N5,N10-methylenetetrahydromethanopterin dehydrogenase-like enzyme